MATRSRLRSELDYFITNQKKLAEKYIGKVLVIKGQKVIGVYESALEAYVEAQKKYRLGEFLIQPCEPGPEAFTVTISSQEIFNG